MKKRLLIQTQLSAIDNRGRFVLEQDSGWQMVMGRVRQMLKLNPELYIDVMGPYENLDGQKQLATSPWELNQDLFASGRLSYVEHWVEPNALVTRYDFDYVGISQALRLENRSIREYDAVYINDPMHLRAFKALFQLKAGYQPKFFVHSHFIDNPECPKFPQETSLWLGQCEAALRADYNFWQCESAMQVFFRSFARTFSPPMLNRVVEHSEAWDDGYSVEEISTFYDATKLRFTLGEWHDKTRGKVVVFFPNRVSPSSGDYTNGVRFLFELLPELRKRRTDFVVVANPSKHFPRALLDERCGPNGFVSFVDGGFDRNEYRFIARNSHVALGLYDKDTYGGTAARECVELGCVPLWLDCNEYSSLAREAECSGYVLAKPDFSDLVEHLSNRISDVRAGRYCDIQGLQRVIRARCSYEATTPAAMQRMGLLA